MRAAAAFLLKSYVALAVVTACALHPAAAAAKEAKLAVVPVPDRSHPIFGVAVQNLVGKPLAQKVSVVPPAVVKKAMTRGHLAGAAAHDPHRLTALGHALRATHVAVIDVRGRGKATLSHVVVIEVATGKTVLNERFPLPQGVLNGAIGRRLAAAIEAKLGAAGAEGGAAIGDGSTADDAPKSGADKKAANGFAFPGDGDKDSPGKLGAAGEANAAASPKKADDAETPEDVTDGALRRNARLAVGLTFMQRTGHLNANPNEGYETPCYCGTNNSANPLFPAFRLEGEIFPAALLSESTAWYTNLGLTLAFGVAPVKSYTTATSTATDANTVIDSTVVDLRLAANYRLMWWDSAMAPDSFIQVGLDYFSFGLPLAAFPGVGYTSPFIGINLHFPVVENLMIVVDAAYMFAISPGGDAAKLLGHQKSGQAFSVGGGLRTGWDRYQLNLTAGYTHYSVSYTGSTSLNATPSVTGGTVQWGNVGLTDALLKIMLTLGVAF